MGGFCGKAKPKDVKQHELAFMNICTEGAYGNPNLIDTIFNRAKDEGQVSQIFEAKDEDGDLPIHKAAMNGNPTVLKWICEKWAANGVPLYIDQMDS